MNKRIVLVLAIMVMIVNSNDGNIIHLDDKMSNI